MSKTDTVLDTVASLAPVAPMVPGSEADEPLGWSDDLQNLLRSGRELSLVESAYIKRLSEEVNARPDHDDQPSQLLAKIESLLAPIRRLPTEILREIFCDYVDTNTFHLDSSPRFISKADTLAAVCSRWRDVALSLPVIWGRLTFFLRGVGIDTSHVLFHLRRHLEYSQDSSLRIALLYGPELPGADACTGHLFEALSYRSTYSRCVDLQVILGLSDADPSNLESFSAPEILRLLFPYPKSIAIHIDTPPESSDANGYIQKFLDVFRERPDRTPRLEVLILVLPPFSFLPFKPFSDSRTPFSQLTRLNVHVTPSAAMVLLSSCTNLICAEFTVPPAVEPSLLHLISPGFEGGEDSGLDSMYYLIFEETVTDDWDHVFEPNVRTSDEIPYTLPFLQSLVVTVQSSRKPAGSQTLWSLFLLFSALTAPVLHSLAISCAGAHSHELYEDSLEQSLLTVLKEFLKRSNASTTLKSFRSECVPFSDREFVEVMEMMPELEALALVECPYGDDKPNHKDILTTMVLERMSFPAFGHEELAIDRPMRPLLLANLQSLLLLSLKDWEDHAFESMLESRVKAGHGSLSTVQLSFPLGLVKHLDLQRLGRLAREGVKIEVFRGLKAEKVSI
ncbi:hypothetical protein VNI00_014298 [Paramarasmius palmivorus]|uniref:F-box domain-containing protein n=1 Tax=Paramarasmius palmivorus TaxID=297713 RepID=A0AAW0BU86_9AGAR